MIRRRCRRSWTGRWPSAQATGAWCRCPTTMGRGVWAVAALCAALLLVGCGGGDDDGGGNAVKADWDLSSSHTMQDVDWSDPGIDALDVRPIESVRLRFPDGSVFEATSGITRIGLFRNGDQLDEVRLLADPMTVDDAYA